MLGDGEAVVVDEHVIERQGWTRVRDVAHYTFVKFTGKIVLALSLCVDDVLLNGPLTSFNHVRGPGARMHGRRDRRKAASANRRTRVVEALLGRKPPAENNNVS